MLKEKDEFSVILQFRISGQGKRWFGDGIGIFLTSNKYLTKGSFHGIDPKYTGRMINIYIILNFTFFLIL